MKKRNTILLVAILVVAISASAQNRFEKIKNDLTLLASDVPALEKKVELSVKEVYLQDFLNALAITNEINISVSQNLNVIISNTFYDVSVSDLLLFLCKEHQLDLKIEGRIISITNYDIPKLAYQAKELKILFKNDTLDLDLKNDTLQKVLKKITQISGINTIMAPGLENKTVSVFIQKQPFESAIDKLAFANNLKARKTNDNFYIIEKKETKKNTKEIKTTKKKVKSKEIRIEKNELGKIKIDAYKQPLSDVIQSVLDILKLDYYIISDLKGMVTINTESANVNELFKNLFKATEYTFSESNNIYIIGNRELEGLRHSEVLKLQHRSVEDIIEFIPSKLKKNVEIKEFLELNSLVISGSYPLIVELKNIIGELDQKVPVILIEVMIVDFQSNYSSSIGLTAQLGGGEEISTGGNLFPGVDFQLNSGSINKLINSFNGFGLMNLGLVKSSFYVSLKALEDNGVINLRSTPKLAALNSHEATLNIGNTEYYLEETNNVIGTQNPQNIITRTYKSINADLSISIKPMVSGDDNITLEIEVSQSDFTN
ncbi:hypothetical protein N9H19_02415, partial [Flavobacteriales bacterium]|nr:hypothetical protein [Flavobacteriales bacterium]